MFPVNVQGVVNIDLLYTQICGLVNLQFRLWMAGTRRGNNLRQVDAGLCHTHYFLCGPRSISCRFLSDYEVYSCVDGAVEA